MGKENWKRILFTIVVAVVTIGYTSCINSIKPIGVMAASKMQLILWDLLKADEYLNEARDPGYFMNADSAAEALYQKVFLMHDTDKESFRKSLTYYQGRPDLSKPLFDSVMAMGERENRIYIVADSIQLAMMEAQRMHSIKEQLWRFKRDSMLKVYIDSMHVQTIARLRAYWDSSASIPEMRLDSNGVQMIDSNVVSGSAIQVDTSNINAGQFIPEALKDSLARIKENAASQQSPSKKQALDTLGKLRLNQSKDSTRSESLFKRAASGRAERLNKLKRRIALDSLPKVSSDH